MRLLSFNTLCSFIVFTSGVDSQINIPINDSLAAHAEMFEVTRGHVFGKKIKKFNFSDYSMHTYKRITSKNKEKENIWGTKMSTESLERASFMLSNSLHDTAQVEMAKEFKLKTEKNMVWGIVHFGDNELENSNFFTAWITINRDTADQWIMFIANSSGLETDNMRNAYLTNGERKIDIMDVQSLEKAKNNFGLPSMGYEFVEAGRSLGAIQLYNGNAFATSHTVWIDQRLDAKNKLLLATAMTAILYEPEEPDFDE